ncbi:MAG: hypothetical protein ABIK15_03760 [Pseudomonadota bacterium]
MMRNQYDMRCCCGKLLAKLTKDGVIIKCKRCKREVVINFSSLDKEAVDIWEKKQGVCS